MNVHTQAAYSGIEAPDRYDHYRFDKSVVVDIKALETDNWHGPFYILKDYAIIAVLVWLVVGVSWWFYPLALIMIGAHQRAISTILHDSAHGVLTKNRLLNFLLGTLPTAWLIFQRFFAYKESHVHTHHPFLGRADADPDLDFFIAEGVFTPRSDRSFTWTIIVLPLLGSKTFSYLRYLVHNRYEMIARGVSDKEGQSRVKRGERWRFELDRWGFYTFWIGIMVIATIHGYLLELCLLWLVPYLTSFHIIGWFIEMSEHCSSIDRQTVNLHMARNRRSRHLEKWLTAINNDNYHLDHHLDPTTPFWRLPEAHVIRMRDPVYAQHCLETGGIFQSGPNGEPSILELIKNQNRQRYCESTGLLA
ncbi:fatty acid desaturase family protein [Mesorhizobium carmichaelinearum]|uniref:fatty acid desaturase family protein n=1 Tax=Mesorhizobium carmichaelinearum TaxID=1208188 RepID=UPI000BA3070D|nr:fatty acid desaturase family protein [Mesorhizobium carmichaelinearum]